MPLSEKGISYHLLFIPRSLELLYLLSLKPKLKGPAGVSPQLKFLGEMQNLSGCSLDLAYAFNKTPRLFLCLLKLDFPALET